MQEYRFRESGYTLYVTWSGKGWIINRVISRSYIASGVGGKFESPNSAIQFARTHYKIIRGLVISGQF